MAKEIEQDCVQRRETAASEAQQRVVNVASRGAGGPEIRATHIHLFRCCASAPRQP